MIAPSRRAAPLILAALAAGCGVTSAGSGSGTLYVEAETKGKPDNTELKVVVRRAGESVQGANVYVEDVDGAVAPRSLEPKSSGYEARFPGYVRALRLTITSGEDELTAGLEGPAAHRITNPPDGSTVLRGEAEILTVEWSADAPADRVIVKAEKLDEVTVEGDPGEYALPLAGLQDGEQEVRVQRETFVDLAGGVEGSIWRARYEVDNRFTLKR